MQILKSGALSSHNPGTSGLDQEKKKSAEIMSISLPDESNNFYAHFDNFPSEEVQKAQDPCLISRCVQIL